MAFSGSYDYGATALQIITAAYENLGTIGLGVSPSSDQQATGLVALNWAVAQLAGRSDGSGGIKTWTRKRGYLFLQKNQSSYSLGPSGDHATLTYVRTTLASAASAGASTIVVSSATGIASTYAIGVEQDSGSIDWTTVNGAPSGTTVTLTATLDSAAAAGNSVFCYQTKLAARPLLIETAVLRDTDGQDTPLAFIDLREYEGIVDKASDGEPTACYYEPSLTNGTLYLDQEPDDVSNVIRFVYQAKPDDLDAAANDVYYPQHWFYALEMALTKRLAMKEGHPWTPLFESNYQEALAVAKGLDAENVTLYFEPEKL